MVKKLIDNWLVLVILWNYGFTSHSFSRCYSCRISVDFVYNYSMLQSRYLKKVTQEVSLAKNEGALNMGIHYDYKSTRGDKAMKKEAKRKARIEQRRARKSGINPKESAEKIDA